MLQHWMRRGVLTATLLGMSALVACSDATPAGKDGVDGTILPPNQDMLPPDVDMGGPRPDMTVREDMNNNPVLGARELQVVGDTSIIVERGARADVRIRLVGFDVQTQAERAIPGQRITMKMLDPTGANVTATGVEGSLLTTGRADTSDLGVATFALAAGQRDARFSLEASVDGADDIAPVYINVIVARPGAGGMFVKVNYASQPGRYNNDFLGGRLTSRVSLYGNPSGDNYVAGPDCATLATVIATAPPAYFAQDIAPFDPARDSVSIDDSDGNSFTVSAVIMKNDKPVGFGCVDAVPIEGGAVANVSVDVYDLPLGFGKPPFRVRNEFNLQSLLEATRGDMSAELPGALGIISDVLDVLRLIGSDDPDRGGQLIEVVCAYFGDASLCDILERVGSRVVGNALDLIPEEVQQIFDVISDVLTIVSELTIVGEIEFSAEYPDEQLRLVGENINRWSRFSFVWRRGCQGGDCERSFPISAISAADQQVIEGLFVGRVDGDDLILEAHGMRFRYGLLILAVAEQWIFPQILQTQGPISFEDFLGTLLAGPCQAVDDFVNSPGLCQDILVASLSDLLIDQVARLQFEPNQFQLQGTSFYADTDGDLRVDRLNGGTWVGTVEISDSLTLDFLGCYEGCRDPARLEEGQQPCVPADCVVPDMAP